MILLDATTKSLQVLLGGAAATTELPVVSAYADVSQTTFAVSALSETDTITTGATAATIVAAPSASTTRKVSLVTVYNVDTASATVTIRVNNNGTFRILVKVALAIGATLQYADGAGWSVIDSSGQIQVTTAASGNALLDGTVHNDTVTNAPTRGSLIYSNATPKWDELLVGSANTVLKSDGTDFSWTAATGTGSPVLATSPTLVTPNIGTPSTAVLTNATGLPIATGLSGLSAANRIPYATSATALTTSANLTFDGTVLAVTGTFSTSGLATLTAGYKTTSGNCYIGDDANTVMTLGLTINQGANDDEAFALKSSDVAHGITNFAETDTYVSMQKADGAEGGLRLRAFRDGTGTTGLILQSFITPAASTTKSTAGTGVLDFQAYRANGAAQQSIGANGNIASFGDNDTVRFILDADGDSHQDVGISWTNFDSHDDLAVLNTIAVEVARSDDPWKDAIRQNLMDALGYMLPRQTLTDMGLVAFNEDGHHFVNMSRLSMLHTGAIRQLGEQNRQLRNEIAHIQKRLASGNNTE